MVRYLKSLRGRLSRLMNTLWAMAGMSDIVSCERCGALTVYIGVVARRKMYYCPKCENVQREKK